MSAQRLVLWRDERDPEQVTVGIERRQAIGAGSVTLHSALFSCHVDALDELVGRSVYREVVEAPAKAFPMGVEIEMRVGDLEATRT